MRQVAPRMPWVILIGIALGMLFPFRSPAAAKVAPNRAGPGASGRIDPATAYFRDALHSAQAGQITRAIASYRAGLHLRPDFMAAHFNLGTLLMQAKQPDQAAHEFSVVAGNAKSPGALQTAARFRLGLLYEQQGNSAKAASQFQQVLQVQPNNADALAELGRMAFKQNDTDNAIHYLEQYSRLRPGDALARFNLGVLYGRKDRMIDALHEFKASLALPGAIPRAAQLNAWVNCGVIYNRLPGRSADAAAAYGKAIGIDPHSVDALLGRAIAEQKLGHLDEALRYYKALLAVQPGSAAAQFNMGMIYVTQRQWPQAANAFGATVHADPQSVEARANLAMACLQDGASTDRAQRTARAVAQYEWIQQNAPSNPVSYAGLAWIYERSASPSDWPKAVTEYEALNKLKPGQKDVLQRLAAVYAHMNKLDMAVQAERKAAQVTPDDPQAWITLSHYQLQQDPHTDDGIITLRYFLTQHPKSVPAMLALASALSTFTAKVGVAPDKAATIDAYKNVLAVQPDSTDALQALDNLLKTDNPKESATYHAQLISIYKAKIKEHPSDIESLQMLASLVRDQDPKGATAYLQQAFNAAPAGAWFAIGTQLASLYKSQGLTEDVRKLYSTMLQKATLEAAAPQPAQLAGFYVGYIRSMLAQEYLAGPNPDYASAARILEDIARANPADPTPWLQVADVREKAGQISGALDDYRRVLDKLPENRQAMDGYMRLALRLNGETWTQKWAADFLGPKLDGPKGDAILANFSACSKSLVKAAWLQQLYQGLSLAHSKSGALIAALADACNANGKWEQALSVYDNLVKDDPINPNYFEQKARIEEQHQQRESALADYRSALRLSPGDDSYGQSILRVLESSPIHSDTEIAALEPIVYSAPSNTVLSTQLSHLYSGPNANQKRIDLYTRLLKSVSIPFYHRALAGALEAMGQKTEAAVQYLILAHELEKSGDTAGAVVDYRAALRVDPDNTEAQAGLEHIQAAAKSNSKPAPTAASPAPQAGMQAPPVSRPSAGPAVISGPAGSSSQPASPAPGNPPIRTIP